MDDAERTEIREPAKRGLRSLENAGLREGATRETEVRADGGEPALGVRRARAHRRIVKDIRR